MERESLRETLARLHRELEDAEPIDASLRSDLEQAVAEIREVIERKDPPEPGHPLRERLEELAVALEQSHPLLTKAVARVVRALAVMGI